MRDVRVATVQLEHASGGQAYTLDRARTVVADLGAMLLPTSSGRRWLRAGRPERYESLTGRTGPAPETGRVRVGG